MEHGKLLNRITNKRMGPGEAALLISDLMTLGADLSGAGKMPGVKEFLKTYKQALTGLGIKLNDLSEAVDTKTLKILLGYGKKVRFPEVCNDWKEGSVYPNARLRASNIWRPALGS